ncbi:MAG: TraK family protein [Rhodospirillaceae bacterium]|jgi:hypothetical protein|nr:TraK family protein [Rhodospirillaceae bacterium]
MSKYYFCQGRIQIIALQKHIFTLLGNGYTLSTIWKELKTSGQINLSRSSFYRLVNKYLKAETSLSQLTNRSSESTDSLLVPHLLPLSNKKISKEKIYSDLLKLWDIK